MKILYIDPWCADGSNLYYYSTGLVEAISKYADVTMICQKHCQIPPNSIYHSIKHFFPVSYHMKQGNMRKIIRGFEYIFTYMFSCRLAKKEKFDVIHLEWVLLYDIDIIVLKILKKMCKVLSLKVHNVLPHSTGSKYVNKFKEIYAIPDVILVHGDALRKEFSRLFPEYSSKVYIQHHGVYVNHDKSYNLENIDSFIQQTIRAHPRVYLFFGRIDRDKGADRLVAIWNSFFSTSNSILIIAGKVDENYDFSKCETIIKKLNNILYIPGFVENDLLNYLIQQCNMIILPYRDGSMSGVIFTAAEFSKPVLSTDFGTASEYILDNVHGFLVNNRDDAIQSALIKVENMTNESLAILGKELHDSFDTNYSWDRIGEKLIKDTFSKVCR